MKDDDLEQQDDTMGPKSKRRKVTFGEAPTTEKTDHITAEKLRELQTELEEAERLEAEAQEMRQRLFGSRVVSRTDVIDLGRDVKSLKRIFPCGGNMAVVVDDREDVWANATDKRTSRKGEPPENLLLVRPYHWQSFLGFADVNNSAGTDLTAPDQNKVTSSVASKETDKQLLWTSDILRRLHKRFYSAESPSEQTVMDTLRHMRREVLSGEKIVLSGLVPLHKQRSRPHAPRPSTVRYAEVLGANVQWSVDESVTHVVAANDGTGKILAARTVRGCFIVKVSWLMECFWTLTRRDERQHLLGAPPKENRVLPMGNSRLENASSSSDDEDDDDLAAEFERAMTH
jgi:RNA polymerase II subunit A-like phosphatase